MIVDKYVSFMALNWYKDIQNLESRKNQYVKVCGEIKNKSDGSFCLCAHNEEINITFNNTYTSTKIASSRLYEFLGLLTKKDSGEFHIQVIFYRECKVPIQLLEAINTLKCKVNEQCEESVRKEKTLRFDNNHI